MPCAALSAANAASRVSAGVDLQVRPAAAAAAARLTAARLRWPNPSQPRRTASQRHNAVLDRGSGSGGAGVLDRPGLETLGPGAGPATDSRGAKLDSNGGRGLGGGAWRVLLIDSDKHTEERCVQAITTGEQAAVWGLRAGHEERADLRHCSGGWSQAATGSSPKAWPSMSAAVCGTDESHASNCFYTVWPACDIAQAQRQPPLLWSC